MINDCFKNSLNNDHVLPLEESQIFILEKTKNLVDFILPNNLTQYPFARVVFALTSRKYVNRVGSTSQSGKGITDLHAVNSALFEVAERFSCAESLQKNGVVFSLSQTPVTLEEIFENFLPSQRTSLRFPSNLRNIPLQWDEFFDLSGNTVIIPYRFFRTILHGSNGVAAGNTLEEAILHGIYEVIERHCLAIAIAEQETLGRINLDSVDSSSLQCFPNICINDISFLGIPTILGLVPRENNRYLGLVGCAGTKEEALSRLLTEIVQLSVKGFLKKEGNTSYYARATEIHQYPKEKIVVFLSEETKNFNEIKNIARWNIKDEIFDIQEKLESHKMKIYWKDVMGSLGVPSVIIFIQRAKIDYKFMINNGLLPFSSYYSKGKGVF